MIFPVLDELMPLVRAPAETLRWKPAWQLLLTLLCIAFVLRIVALDILGGILTALMLCIGVVMVVDEMKQMPKFVLMYAVLCVLNLLFDLIPLVASLAGRSETSTKRLSSVHDGQTTRTTYVKEKETTAFFSPTEGVQYNIESTAMLLAPMCWAIGSFL